MHPDEVVVVDRQPDAALETSFANAAQISVSYCEPWANKHAPAKLLKWMFRNDAPLPLVRRAGAALREGANLLIFPEGTRTVRPPVGPFKGGFALMARNAGAPIQAVFIEADTPYLRKGWPLFRKPPLPLAYRARLGRRFAPTASAAELEAYYAAELRR